jgi:hypothetical protein
MAIFTLYSSPGAGLQGEVIKYNQIYQEESTGSHPHATLIKCICKCRSSAVRNWDLDWAAKGEFFHWLIRLVRRRKVTHTEKCSAGAIMGTSKTGCPQMKVWVTRVNLCFVKTVFRLLLKWTADLIHATLEGTWRVLLLVLESPWQAEGHAESIWHFQII